MGVVEVEGVDGWVEGGGDAEVIRRDAVGDGGAASSERRAVDVD